MPPEAIPEDAIILSIMLRRTLIGMAPAVVLPGTRRPWREVERMLGRGDVGGRLSVDDLPTPALLVDLDALESNIAKMAAHCQAKRLALRPHGKTHKCPHIAKRLIAAGAVGCCAAKLSEAEAFAKSGVSGLLITTAVIGQHKIERAAILAKSRPDTILCVDNAQNAAEINDAARAAKTRLNVAIDLYVGNRTGIPAGDPAIALAEAIAKLPNLKLAGLQAYAGHAAHRNGFEARRTLSQTVMQTAVETRRALEAKGIACPLLTGGSTGTYNIDCDIEGITELQPGSFVFMDVDYGRIGGPTGAAFEDFRYALTVMTTVVSKPSANEVVVDGGLKAFSTDKPFPPVARAIDGLVFSWGGDEHGKLNLAKASRTLNVGDRVEFVIPHCDPTVNLYDRIFAVRRGRVESWWPISARGMSQ